MNMKWQKQTPFTDYESCICAYDIIISENILNVDVEQNYTVFPVS